GHWDAPEPAGFTLRLGPARERTRPARTGLADDQPPRGGFRPNRLLPRKKQMSAEGKWAFFRQSGWLVIATGISGVFLVLVYSVKLPDLSTFHSMLRLFMVLGVATSGLQVIVAQDAASVVTPVQERN